MAVLLRRALDQPHSSPLTPNAHMHTNKVIHNLPCCPVNDFSSIHVRR